MWHPNNDGWMKHYYIATMTCFVSVKHDFLLGDTKPIHDVADVLGSLESMKYKF